MNSSTKSQVAGEVLHDYLQLDEDGRKIVRASIAALLARAALEKEDAQTA